jgi:uncharacterized DUF497 family protein
MDLEAAGFDWDDGNRAKCLKHGLSATDIEALFLDDPAISGDFGHSLTETRWRAVGRLPAKGRYVFVVFTFRVRDGMRLIRPISARFMHKKEVERYEARSD